MWVYVYAYNCVCVCVDEGYDDGYGLQRFFLSFQLFKLCHLFVFISVFLFVLFVLHDLTVISFPLCFPAVVSLQWCGNAGGRALAWSTPPSSSKSGGASLAAVGSPKMTSSVRSAFSRRSSTQTSSRCTTSSRTRPMSSSSSSCEYLPPTSQATVSEQHKQSFSVLGTSSENIGTIVVKCRNKHSNLWVCVFSGYLCNPVNWFPHFGDR